MDAKTTATTPTEKVQPDYVVSVCTVVHNDGEIVEGFLREAASALSEAYRYFELVVVDSHSTDGAAERVERLLPEIPNIRLIRLSRTYNREIALSAALENCIGDYIVTLDLRLDPVEMIVKIVDRIMDASDVVIGRYRTPRGSWLRRMLSSSSRKLASYFLDMPLDSNTGYCLGFSRRAANSLTRIHSKGRFIIYDCRLVGYRNTLLEYSQALRPGARAQQEAIWTAAASRLQMVIAHSLLPLRIATLLGVAASFLNLLYLGYILAVVIVKKRIAEGWLTTSLSHTVMFLALFLILAILSEYVGRILEEAKDQPRYFVERESSSAVSCYDKSRLNIV